MRAGGGPPEGLLEGSPDTRRHGIARQARQGMACASFKAAGAAAELSISQAHRRGLRGLGRARARSRQAPMRATAIAKARSAKARPAHRTQSLRDRSLEPCDC